MTTADALKEEKCVSGSPDGLRVPPHLHPHLIDPSVLTTLIRPSPWRTTNTIISENNNESNFVHRQSTGTTAGGNTTKLTLITPRMIASKTPLRIKLNKTFNKAKINDLSQTHTSILILQNFKIPTADSLSTCLEIPTPARSHSIMKVNEVVDITNIKAMILRSFKALVKS